MSLALDALVAQGHTRIEPDGRIIGIASDGVEVALGDTSNLKGLDAYLKDFPTPDCW